MAQTNRQQKQKQSASRRSRSSRSADEWAEHVAQDGSVYVLHLGLSLHIVDRHDPLMLWPASVVQVSSGRICIAYDGWSDNHNEWIDSSSGRIRLDTVCESRQLNGLDNTNAATASDLDPNAPTPIKIVSKTNHNQKVAPAQPAMILSAKKPNKPSANAKPLESTENDHSTKRNRGRPKGSLKRKFVPTTTGPWHESVSIRDLLEQRAREREEERRQKRMDEIQFEQYQEQQRQQELEQEPVMDAVADQDINTSQSIDQHDPCEKPDLDPPDHDSPTEPVVQKRGRGRPRGSRNVPHLQHIVDLDDMRVFPTRRTLAAMTEIHANQVIGGLPVGTRVEVADAARTFWPGRIVETRGSKRRVSYDGWGAAYDEWIDYESVRIRLLEKNGSLREGCVIPDGNRDETRTDGQDPQIALDVQDLVPKSVEVLSATVDLRMRDRPQKTNRQAASATDGNGDQDIQTASSTKLGQTRNKQMSTFFRKIHTFAPHKLVDVADNNNTWWPAYMLEKKKSRILIRYEEFGPEFDEWLDADSPRLRLRDECSNEQQIVQSAVLNQSHLNGSSISGKAKITEICKSEERQDVDRDGSSHQRTVSVKKRLRISRSKNDKSLENDASSNHPNKSNNADEGSDTPPTADSSASVSLVADHDASDLNRLKPSSNGKSVDTTTKRSTTRKQRKHKCQQCKKQIRHNRYYCTYCETSSSSFDLCFVCFQCNFPIHGHPRSSFAIEKVIDKLPTSTKQLQLKQQEHEREQDKRRKKHRKLLDSPYDAAGMSFELDTFDDAFKMDADAQGLVSCVAEPDQLRRVCAFCNDRSETVSSFVRQAFVATTSKGTKRVFWAHDACARYSPEVHATDCGDKWYNVARAMTRGRNLRCFVCKERGATIGCFDPKCNRSFHVSCTRKPLSHFAQGILFWCPIHEAFVNRIDDFDDVYHCDVCGIKLGQDANDGVPWHSCTVCETDDYFTTFDLCTHCFENRFPNQHAHDPDCFAKITFDVRMQQTAEQRMKLQQDMGMDASIDNNAMILFRDRKSASKLPPIPRASSGRLQHPRDPVCAFCWANCGNRWRRSTNGMIVCESCFMIAPAAIRLELDVDAFSGDNVLAKLASVYHRSTQAGAQNSHQMLCIAASDVDPQIMNAARFESFDPYHTRTSAHRPICTGLSTVSSPFSFHGRSMMPIQLASYGPHDDHLFSLVFESTFYDLPGRAPRWANHSGSDYHGTWLPQIVRWSLERYTERGERVLSNFLGRGTDAIESMLLGRRCCGVDINPVAISLSQRNMSFSMSHQSATGSSGNTESNPSAAASAIAAMCRPLLVCGDSRQLTGPLFEDESYHHIMSHPPYKDCVVYSSNIDGDLSRLSDLHDFSAGMHDVALESYRLLKRGRRLTLCIGDNRRGRCFQPVAFSVLRSYLSAGFEVEEWVLKRQHQCQMMQLGVYLSVKHDFLLFTHETFAILRKSADTNTSPPPSFTDTTTCLGIVDGGPMAPEHMIDPSLDCVWTSTFRRIIASPIDRRRAVLGTIWSFAVSATQISLPKLAMSRVVQRFGRDDALWEQISFPSFLDRVLADAVYDDVCAERSSPIDDDIPSIVNSSKHYSRTSFHDFKTNTTRSDIKTDFGDSEDDDRLPEYERARARRIRENNDHLLELGLISELGTETDDGKDDVVYLSSLLSSPVLATVHHSKEDDGGSDFSETEAPSLVFVPHLNIPSTAILLDGPWVMAYRTMLVRIVRSAVARMHSGALLVIGVKDVRVRKPFVEESSDQDKQTEIDDDPIHDITQSMRNLSFSNHNQRDGNVANGVTEKTVPFNNCTHLVPLSLLVLEDLDRATPPGTIRLKEYIGVVPRGYERRSDMDIDTVRAWLSEDEQEWKDERRAERDGRMHGTRRRFPIVHAQYFVYAKL